MHPTCGKRGYVGLTHAAIKKRTGPLEYTKNDTELNIELTSVVTVEESSSPVFLGVRVVATITLKTSLTIDGVLLIPFVGIVCPECHQHPVVVIEAWPIPIGQIGSPLVSIPESTVEKN